MARQATLFSDDTQPDMFGEEPAPEFRPDLEKVRRRLQKMLAEAKAASNMPWRPPVAKLYQTIFPEMTRWLPEEEAAQLRLQFETELVRLRG